MNKMRHLLFVALFLVFSVSAQAAKSPNSDKYPTRDSPLPITVVQSADDARMAAEREKSTDDFNNTSLLIQAKTEDDAHGQEIAAWVAAGLLIAETLIAAAALIYLRQTYVETRRTAIASLRSARMARKSAKIAKDALGANRAWMTAINVIPIIARPLTTQDGEFDEAILLSVAWNNGADSPALNVDVMSRYKLIPIASVEYPTFPPELWDDPEGAQYANKIIGPKATVVGMHQTLLGDEIEKFIKREAKVILYSAVKYRDIFQPDEPRQSEVCYEVFARSIVSDPASGRPVRIDIDSRQVGPQNTAS